MNASCFVIVENRLLFFVFADKIYAAIVCSHPYITVFIFFRDIYVIGT